MQTICWALTLKVYLSTNDVVLSISHRYILVRSLPQDYQQAAILICSGGVLYIGALYLGAVALW